MTLILLLLLHPSLIQAGSLAAFPWQYPPNAGASRDYTDDVSLPLGSTQHIKWGAPKNISEYQVEVTQDTNPTSFFIIYKKGSSDEETQGFNWTVTTGGANLESTRAFYFWAHTPEMQWPEGSTSHYFDIVDAEVSFSSASAASTTTIASVSTLTSALAMTTLPSTSTPLPTTTSPSIPSVQSPHSESNNKLALGLGVGLGIPLALLIGIYVGIKLVTARRSDNQAPLLNPAETYATIPMEEHSGYHLTGHVPPTELSTGGERHQMP